MQYTIKQFAELFRTTEHTIRYYTDIHLLPCRRDRANRRVFDEESEENLRARYRIILRQRDQARKRVEEAQATAAYMDQKAKHYEDILAGRIPDDTNPGNWTLDDLSFSCMQREDNPEICSYNQDNEKE